MWVPVAVWQLCELLYTCYLITYLLVALIISQNLWFTHPTLVTRPTPTIGQSVRRRSASWNAHKYTSLLMRARDGPLLGARWPFTGWIFHPIVHQLVSPRQLGDWASTPPGGNLSPREIITVGTCPLVRVRDLGSKVIGYCLGLELGFGSRNHSWQWVSGS